MLKSRALSNLPAMLEMQLYYKQIRLNHLKQTPESSAEFRLTVSNLRQIGGNLIAGLEALQ